MEVFISWTGEDRDVKNALAEKLHAENIECWDSDEYCTSDYSQECIAAIKKCGVFIVIVSKAAMEKGYVLNEVITARNLENQGQLNILVYKLTDEPYTDNFEFQLNHISFVSGNLVQRKESLAGESGLDIIVKRTKRLLEKREKGEAEKPFDVFLPEIDGVEIRKTGYFVENSRDEILDAMENAFETSNVIILKEIFGFGKRTTIRKYLDLHKKEFDTKVMVTNNNHTLREFLLMDLEFVNVNKRVFEELDGDALIKEKFRFLEKLDNRTILVIPDLRFESRIEEWICDKLAGLKCKIIMVTQESAEGYGDWFPVIELGRMTDEHLMELFFHHYEHAYDDEKEALSEPLVSFFKNIGGHTKTVELTASVLSRELRIHPEEIPNYLKMSGQEGLKLKDRILNQISYLFEVEKLSEDEILTLLVAAYMAVPSISEKGFRRLLESCGVNDWQNVINLDKRRWLDIDMRNRSVSIEPLIAQIVINKYSDNYYVMYKCFEYLMDIVRVGTFENANLKNYSKMSYFLSNIGRIEEAEIIGLFVQYLMDKEHFEAEKMEVAVAKYEAKLADQEPDVEEEYISSDEWEEESEDEWEEEESDDEWEEEWNNEDWKSLFDGNIDDFFSGVFLSNAKLIAQNSLDIVMNLNLVHKLEEQSIQMIDPEKVFGLSKKELDELMASYREAIENEEDFEEEDYAGVIVLEVLALYEAISNKDYKMVMTKLEFILNSIEKMPEILEIDDFTEIFFSITFVLAMAFIRSNAEHQAVLFCKRVLGMCKKVEKRDVLLKAYITALRRCYQYTDELYNAYEEVLRNFEKNVGESFNSRREMMEAKKDWMMKYAVDLAVGQRMEEAEKHFATAKQIERDAFLDEVVQLANEIIETFIRLGEFEEAVRFVKTYFPEREMKFYYTNGNEETKQHIAYFASLKSMEQTQEVEEEEFFSYYQTFSRKNNGLLEQKYCALAEKATKIDFSHLSNEEIASYALELKKKAKRFKMNLILPEAFALASEAGLRVLGYKHHYVQYMGAAAMADGKIAEILNGEGKTYTIVLVAFLNYIYGKKSFVVDSSSYLTKRNYEWMRGVYLLLGMSCEYISAPIEIVRKKRGEQSDVTYSNLQNLIMGYLTSELDLEYMRGNIQYDCAIIDEADSVLVDESQLSYSLASGKPRQSTAVFHRLAYNVAQQVAWDDEYYKYEKKSVTLHTKMYQMIEQTFHVSYSNVNHLDMIKLIEEIVNTAILCCNHYEKEVDYHIIKGVPVWENKDKGIFEEFTPSYKYFLCRINGIDTRFMESQLRTRQMFVNSICTRDFFRKFKMVCGTTATAVSFKKEFKEIYGLEYISVPPYKPCIRADYQVPLYMNMYAKDEAITDLICEKYEKGQPVLVISQSVKESEKYSKILTRIGIPHKTLNARNRDDSSDIIAGAGELGSVLLATFLVNRGTDIKLGGDPELKTRRELVEMGVDVTELNSFVYSLPTKEQMESDLYQKYYSILKKNRILAASEREKVVEAGGLCVIGTSYFSEPRTEQQTRGRSGRQGDVGESYVFRSIEDEVMGYLLSDAMIERMQSIVSDTDTDSLDSKILSKSLDNAQKKLHNALFAKIRNSNNASMYLDRSRKDFIGKKQELQEGIISYEDFLKDWAEDKSTMKQLESLQQGKQVWEAKALSEIYRKNEGKLQKVKGKKAEKLLLELAKQELLGKYNKELQLKESDIDKIIQRILLNSWAEYLDIVTKNVGKADMTTSAMEKYLEMEKRRILSNIINILWGVKRR